MTRLVKITNLVRGVLVAATTATRGAAARTRTAAVATTSTQQQHNNKNKSTNKKINVFKRCPCVHEYENSGHDKYQLVLVQFVSE